MYFISFYVPEAQLEEVKKAMFSKGAGNIGGYQHCAWQSKGQGQFMPKKDSAPAVGEHHKLESLEEYKVEMVCPRGKIDSVIEALKESHPYETPAYAVFETLAL